MSSQTIRSQPRKNYVIQIYVNPHFKEVLEDNLADVQAKYKLKSRSETIRFCLEAGIKHLTNQ